VGNKLRLRREPVQHGGSSSIRGKSSSSSLIPARNRNMGLSGHVLAAHDQAARCPLPSRSAMRADQPPEHRSSRPQGVNSSHVKLCKEW
jgi:hypothetical protein